MAVDHPVAEHHIMVNCKNEGQKAKHPQEKSGGKRKETKGAAHPKNFLSSFTWRRKSNILTSRSTPPANAVPVERFQVETYVEKETNISKRMRMSRLETKPETNIKKKSLTAEPHTALLDIREHRQALSSSQQSFRFRNASCSGHQQEKQGRGGKKKTSTRPVKLCQALHLFCLIQIDRLVAFWKLSSATSTRGALISNLTRCRHFCFEDGIA